MARQTSNLIASRPVLVKAGWFMASWRPRFLFGQVT
jgi:hypothetical protein